MMVRAAGRLRNRCSFRHSSRKRPFKLSTKPFYCGLPGGVWRSRTRRLKAFDEENHKLKNLMAEAMLDAATLREALEKSF
jgi:hypothetical protein